jgi:hypothetical protein
MNWKILIHKMEATSVISLQTSPTVLLLLFFQHDQHERRLKIKFSLK